MKHLRLFESFEDIDSIYRKYDIRSYICSVYDIKNYTINSDGLVDVDDDDVNLYNNRLTKLPLRFGKVTGNFYCHRNRLTTLEGAPSYVGGVFLCYDNQLTTLEGGPKEVEGYYSCGFNKLISLEGSPEYIGGDLYCYNNKLTSLEGCPDHVGGDLYCSNNKLTTLEGGPREVGGNFYCEYNPVYSIYQLFRDHKSYINSLDYGYLRGMDIVKSRFQEACEEVGIKVPEKIKGYNYI
jgi:hypothetical protein